MCKMSLLDGDIRKVVNLCIFKVLFLCLCRERLFPVVLIKFSFVLLYVRGMVQVVVVQDTAGIPCATYSYILLV